MNSRNPGESQPSAQHLSTSSKLPPSALRPLPLPFNPGSLRYITPHHTTPQHPSIHLLVLCVVLLCVCACVRVNRMPSLPRGHSITPTLHTHSIPFTPLRPLSWSPLVYSITINKHYSNTPSSSSSTTSLVSCSNKLSCLFTNLIIKYKRNKQSKSSSSPIHSANRHLHYSRWAGRVILIPFYSHPILSLTSHLSPLTSHLSPLTSHLSPLTSHLSPPFSSLLLPSPPFSSLLLPSPLLFTYILAGLATARCH